MRFICEECAGGGRARRSTEELTERARRRWHEQCRGGTWCDCQHAGSGTVR